MKAVILAAGAATRLRPLTDNLPKTLLPVDGTPILQRSMSNLLRCGFSEFVIVTGFLDYLVREEVESWFPNLDVQFVTNTAFATTNNAYSLLLARPFADEDAFVLLDGDVVFDVAVIEKLLAHGPDCLAVRSVGEMGEEEMKVTVDGNDRVTQIRKDISVRACMGESVGIELFSGYTSKRLFATLAERVISRGLKNEYYEASFQQIIDEGAHLYGVDIGTLYATEIDTLEDLQAATSMLAQLSPQPLGLHLSF